MWLYAISQQGRGCHLKATHPPTDIAELKECREQMARLGQQRKLLQCNKLCIYCIVNQYNLHFIRVLVESIYYLAVRL